MSNPLVGRLKGIGRTVACLRCGYNLTGLREARCPECGTQYTLDELLAGQVQETVESAAASEQPAIL